MWFERDISYQLFYKVLYEFYSDTLQPYRCNVLFFVLSESVWAENAANSLVWFDIHFIVHLQLFFFGSWSRFDLWFLRRGLLRDIYCELSLHPQVRYNMHLGNLLRFKVNFQPNILYEVWSFDCKGTLFAVNWQRKRIKREFARESFFVVLHRVVMKVKVTSWIKKHSVYSRFLPNNSRVREP